MVGVLLCTNMLRRIVKVLMPYGLVQELARWRDAKRKAPYTLADTREEFHRQRKMLIAQSVLPRSVNEYINATCYDALVNFLIKRGIPRSEIIHGSIERESLAFIGLQMRRHLRSGAPLTGLHIGNYLGVSLAYVTGIATQIDAESRVVSIDPNVTHRGVDNPQTHVLSLLAACGIAKNVLVIAGYSGDRNISNDGRVFANYNPANMFVNESACERCIESLRAIGCIKWDFILIDGNHEGEYLKGEIQSLTPMMKQGGLLVLDDVSTAWMEVQRVFESLSCFGYETVARDKRVGIVRRVRVDKHGA
jgi:predicted O-methyltransferase YrrM